MELQAKWYYSTERREEKYSKVELEPQLRSIFVVMLY
jgi:hypothetical protein